MFVVSERQVMLDPDVNMTCDVLLFKIDVRAGYWGMYNFYKMQVVSTYQLYMLNHSAVAAYIHICTCVLFLLSTGIGELASPILPPSG